MPAGTLIVLIIVCAAVVAGAAVAAALAVRQAMLRRQFGTEYDRLARQSGHRRARAELMARKRRVAGLGIRPLTVEQHARYTSEWTAAQELFVERPADALAAAAALVKRVGADRGYRMQDRGQVMADLSVGHARRLDAYRRAEEAADQADSASTEDLRQAMLWYRAMFRDLAGAAGRPAAGPAQPPRRPGEPRPRVPVPRVQLPRVRVPRPRVSLPQLPRPRTNRPSRSQGTSAT